MADDIQPTSNRDLFLPARKLYIAWVENPDYWRWNSDHPNIGEVAELVKVYFLAVSGWVDTSTLEENTRYEAYLVYSLRNNATGFKNKPVEVFLNVIGHEDQNSKQKVFLEAPATPWTPGETSVTSPLLHGHSVQRDDGWKEVKLGEFLNDQDKELEVGMNHTEGKLKTGIVIRGIQIRPKLQN
ncbi:F-box protein At2g02240-like isoform X2 [Glycine soja]|uniref:F-box protein At2g02240-like isoform X2 n=1 Tax=Glycine soja TaxID=3848 RepID=UPI00103C3D6D|nr:F-box protein At2g02240-like isoform X2 [Glycine soja]